MNFEQATASRLLRAPAVNSLVQSRIDWDRLPQGASLPHVVLTIIADPRPQTMKASQIDRPTTVQVDCWASRKADAVALRQAVLAALISPVLIEGVRFQRAQAISVRPGFDQQTASSAAPSGERYREIIDITLWHNG